MFRKPWWLRWGSAVGAAIVIGLITKWFLGIIAFVAPLVYFKWREGKAAQDLLQCSGVRQLDTQLTQVRPLAA